jgi:hypothetical protein
MTGVLDEGYCNNDGGEVRWGERCLDEMDGMDDIRHIIVDE